ncbi:MAG: OB-fold nucleic acid binding domain-containing protein, partial [Candidatus Woesearchaeota archaeon]|nr:OB-fold nucleic acid binding domain-containing protein [Candidatus Woesearchaeota archaeon]
WEPNYIIYNNKEVSRINIIGVVVSKNQDGFSGNSSVIIDDGSGRISLKSFEPNKFLDGVSVGDIVVVIGRPREYGGEIYIMPEMGKRIGKEKWVEVRRLELEIEGVKQNSQKIMPSSYFGPEKVAPPSLNRGTNKEIVYEENKKEEVLENFDKDDGGFLQIVELIRRFDKGDGADYREILENSTIENTENIIKELLKNGDIFELRPGRLKLL